jgi:uncharacterized protein YjbJ (UPF0337 family)
VVFRTDIGGEQLQIASGARTWRISEGPFTEAEGKVNEITGKVVGDKKLEVKAKIRQIGDQAQARLVRPANFCERPLAFRNCVSSN